MPDGKEEREERKKRLEEETREQLEDQLYVEDFEYLEPERQES